MKYVHGLIAGHGGMVNGKYTTAPSKMYTFDDGLTIYEGVENRRVRDMILKEAERCHPDLEIIDIVPENDDVPLETRVHRANKLHQAYREQDKELLVWELHNNAGKGTGYEIFTTTKSNFSDKMAECWIQASKEITAKERNRGHKEKDFYILKNLKCYGVLIEFFFFDNREDVDRETTEKGVYDNAMTVIEAMYKVQEISQ